MPRKHIPLSTTATFELGQKGFRLEFLAPRFGRLFRRYRRERFSILLENARDYRRAQLLWQALERLTHPDPELTSVVEKQVGGGWRPFRVEHTLSGSLRGSVGGGTFTGSMTPNLVESSSVLFLQNDAGATLRALLPSQGAAAGMLAAAFQYWEDKANPHYLWRSNYQKGTHVSDVLHHFARLGSLPVHLAYAQAIDMLDASCQKPLEERPVVHVKGNLIQDGVAFVSALEINGEPAVLIPTTFFARLTAAVQPYVEGSNPLRLPYAA